MKYIGSCANISCERRGKDVIFPVPHDKVDAFRSEPQTCAKCGEFLQDDVHDVE